MSKKPQNKPFHVRLTTQEYKRLKIAAEKQERTMANLMRLLTTEGLDRLEQRGA